MTNDDFSASPWGLSSGPRTTYMDAYSMSAVASLVASESFARVVCVDACAWLASVCAGDPSAYGETVRTLHSNDNGVLALEFQLDVPNAVRRCRHVYNIVFGLCGHAKATISQIREKLDYAVVLKDADARNSTVSNDTVGLSAGLYGTQPERWEFDMEDLRHNGQDVRRLSGLVCRKAYQLFSSELTDFAIKKGLVR